LAAFEVAMDRIDRKILNYDFVVIVIANSMEAYGVFARKCFESNRYVTRFDTHVALERVKVGLSLPIEDLK
jgi:Lrp/AsnC family transcriptional regulator, leucine-responsive regulatory protein